MVGSSTLSPRPKRAFLAAAHLRGVPVVQHMTWRRRAVGVAAVAALMTTATMTGVSGASARPTVRGFDGKTIEIAGLGLASNFTGSDIGTKARIKRANNTKEIKGVKFDYAGFADDKGDPAVATSEARRLGHPRWGLRDRAGHLDGESGPLSQPAARALRRVRVRRYVLHREADHLALRVRVQRVRPTNGAEGDARHLRQAVRVRC